MVERETHKEGTVYVFSVHAPGGGEGFAALVSSHQRTIDYPLHQAVLMTSIHPHTKIRRADSKSRRTCKQPHRQPMNPCLKRGLPKCWIRRNHSIARRAFPACRPDVVNYISTRCWSRRAVGSTTVFLLSFCRSTGQATEP